MENLLLRTLTLKSRIGFGKYRDLTVADMFASERYSELIQMYYNLDKINYTSDILERLGLIQITKPGKSPELKNVVLKDFWKKKNEGMTPLERLKDYNSMMKTKAICSRNYRKIADITNNNRSALQFKNHGHH